MGFQKNKETRGTVSISFLVSGSFKQKALPLVSFKLALFSQLTI